MSTEDTRTVSLAARAADAFAGFRAGDVARMDELVDLVTPVLWHTARAQGTPYDLARDVVQSAWLRLVEHAERITDPQAVLGWLVTTTRREAWRMVRVDRRTVADGLGDGDASRRAVPGPGTGPAGGDRTRPEHAPDPEESVVVASEHRTLWRHLTALPERCRALLRVIAFSDRPDYAAIAAALRMPVGSIGPTRGRCLAKLRTALRDDPAWEGHR